MNPQVRKYIESAPEAISGSGGHVTTLKVARSLHNGFTLDRQEVLEGLRAYNSRLSDKWSDRELEHKADSAATGTYDKPRGWMLGDEQPRPREVYISSANNCTTEEAKHVEKTPQFRHKYILATVATVKSHTSPNTGAHAVGFQESERTVATVAESGEAKRIAGELVKAPTDPYVPTREQLVIVPPGLTRKERMKFLQDDLDEAFGE